ncbi:hypothetical protein E4T56_gene7284 [Termitomyces sp. T112]|nr:hypothetical protein E4T56_gene7284 [Termitomyces sp. T112]
MLQSSPEVTVDGAEVRGGPEKLDCEETGWAWRGSGRRPYGRFADAKGTGIGGAWESKPSNIDQSTASDSGVGGEVEARPPLCQEFPNFVMSSPSIPVVSPAPLPSDLDECQGLELVVCGGGGGFPGGPKADQVLSRVAKGGEHGVVCGEGGVFAGWLGNGGVLGSDAWEAPSLPVLGGGTQQEAAWARAVSGASGVSPLFSNSRHSLGTVVESPRAYSFDHGGLPLQAGGGFDDITEKEAMEQERNTLVRVATERALEVWGLWERLTRMEGQPAGEVEGQGRVPGGDALWVELEAVRRREDWLANEAALGRVGILRWVREHWVLLDGASAVFVSIQDGLMQGSAVQPPELQQGMVQLERLLAGHRRRNVVAPGSWWEVAADTGEALPGLAEVLAVVRAQMEVDLGIGLPGDPGRE